MRLPKNKYVSRRAMFILYLMLQEEDYDHELVHEMRKWMVGTRGVNGKACDELLQLVLVHAETELGSSFERFTLNEDGRWVLASPTYKPRILIELEKARKQCGARS